MTQVEFHLIAGAEPRTRARYACELAAEAFRLGRRVHLHCSDAGEAATLDALLWTFRDRAFVPHSLGAGDEPVVVDHAEPAATPREVLINLAPAVPAWFASFEQVAEIIGEDPAVKAAGRERYKVYRERGCTPETITPDPIQPGAA